MQRKRNISWQLYECPSEVYEDECLRVNTIAVAEVTGNVVGVVVIFNSLLQQSLEYQMKLGAASSELILLTTKEKICKPHFDT
ncbi:hypothetical protein DOY81_004124 [Sarcophaga bullata]|nr:hypothetical protein DOY81_004124 [Sarcophaga bullata]